MATIDETHNVRILPTLMMFEYMEAERAGTGATLEDIFKETRRITELVLARRQEGYNGND